MRQSARTRRQRLRRGLKQQIMISVLGLWSKPIIKNLDVALGKSSETLEHWFYYSKALSYDQMDVTRSNSASPTWELKTKITLSKFV